MTIAKYIRPYFRFGNGCWGQANFRVSIFTKASGMERTLTPRMVTWNMVPALLEMDHLSEKDSPGSALTIDFNTGMAIESLNPSPTIHHVTIKVTISGTLSTT